MSYIITMDTRARNGAPGTGAGKRYGRKKASEVLQGRQSKVTAQSTSVSGARAVGCGKVGCFTTFRFSGEPCVTVRAFDLRLAGF